MKLNDFKSGSKKSSTDTIKSRIGKNPEIRVVNETKTEAYEAQINELTKKVTHLDSVSSALATAKIQRKEAVELKNKYEADLSELQNKFKLLSASFKDYEDREPRIKKIIQQHRELNGEIAEFQSKLQVAVDQHDQKVDTINEKIALIANLKSTLHAAENSDTKAQQAKLEAIMERDVLTEQLKKAKTETDEISIIYQEEKAKLSVARHERNVFEALKNNAEDERDKATSLAHRLQIWGEKMETKTTSSNLTTKRLRQENTELKTSTKEMILEIKGLTDELSFISKLNKEMIKELKKPRHATIASISKNEGFKFPTSFEARNNTLGTAKPTLLRKQE